MICKRSLTQAWLFLILATSILATDQIPDVILFQGELYNLNETFPLDPFLQKFKLFPGDASAPMLVTRRGEMDGTNNHNFHIANWIISDNRLYLTDIQGFVYADFNAWYLESIQKELDAVKDFAQRERLTTELSKLKESGVNIKATPAMDFFFPDRSPEQMVFAEWFSGRLQLEHHSIIPYSTKPGKRFELVVANGIIQSVDQR